jgi:hypothetical protein
LNCSALIQIANTLEVNSNDTFGILEPTPQHPQLPLPSACDELINGLISVERVYTMIFTTQIVRLDGERSCCARDLLGPLTGTTQASRS